MNGQAGGYRGRFAPSPTGPLHFGSLVAACASFLDARAVGGAWLLRIDDIDQTRARREAADDILRTLEAFGLTWDETPQYPSQRAERHRAALATLARRGRLYACDCSRARVRAAGLQGAEGPRYSGRCRARGLPLESAGLALRARTPDETIRVVDRVHGEIAQNLQRDLGDFIVRRADGGFAYQLAVVVDDADWGIDHVVRGADLLLSTPRQVWLQRELGLPTPTYAHLPLVRDAAGRKLSKSDRAHPVERNDPLPALLSALRFLRQPLPPERPDGLDELWRWAIAHWRVRALPATR